MRFITIIVGSKNDLKQCFKGLKWLFEHGEEVLVKRIHVASQHRHTLKVQEILTNEVESLKGTAPTDAIIVGAGWANHLTGCCDAFLRFHLKNATIPVIGVAFEDREKDLHTEAAILSITQVPGTQVIFEDADGQFVGEDGFLAACEFAAQGKFPQLVLKEPPESMDFSIAEALQEAQKLAA
jgi:phosphoribosylcarboxyaminoimidazole (NCAIR) mutase